MRFLRDNALSLVLIGTFLHCLVGMTLAGWFEHKTALLHVEPVPTALGYLLSARLWLESFQNWPSEFLAIAIIVILSIMLCYRGSPESKPVAAPHSQTGA